MNILAEDKVLEEKTRKKSNDVVYIVMSGCVDDVYPEKVFSSSELAKQYIAEKYKSKKDVVLHKPYILVKEVEHFVEKICLHLENDFCRNKNCPLLNKKAITDEINFCSMCKHIATEK